MASLPSASGLARAERCPGSEALPHVRRVTRYSERGDAVHRYLARVPEIGAEAALAEVPEEHQEDCELIDLSQLPACAPGSYAAEVSWAYDVETGMVRELGRGVGRDAAYGACRPSEVPGTADSVGLLGDDGVIVTDYKSGWAGHVAPAAENFQLAVYALLAARCWGRSRAVVAVIRVRDDGSSWIDRAELDPFALDMVEARLTRIVSAVLEERAAARAGEAPTLAEGEWCRWCAALPACPAKAALAVALANDAAIPHVDGHLVLTADTAAAAWERIKQARLVLDRVQEAIEAYAEATPLRLPSGNVVGPKEESRESVKAPIALRVLEERYGKEVAEEACERDTSKAAIRRALQRYASVRPGLKITKLVEAALEAIREAGGAPKKTSKRVKEYEPKDEKAPAAAASTEEAAHA